jgi:hypothetical protein
LLFLYRQVLGIELPWLQNVTRAVKPRRLPVLERGEVIVRDAKGGRDRVTVLPAALVTPLRDHLAKLHDRFQRQRKLREPGVALPAALVRKYPHAATHWGWQWVSA